MTYLEKLATIYVFINFVYIVHAYFRDRKNLKLYEESEMDRKQRESEDKIYEEMKNLLKGIGSFNYRGKNYKVVEMNEDSK